MKCAKAQIDDGIATVLLKGCRRIRIAHLFTQSIFGGGGSISKVFTNTIDENQHISQQVLQVGTQQ